MLCKETEKTEDVATEDHVPSKSTNLYEKEIEMFEKWCMEKSSIWQWSSWMNF